MIHPTRTDLLQLKQKASSMVNSVAILKARRHALIRSFLDSVRPFARSRDAIRLDYGQALAELHLSEGHEGMAEIEALDATAAREVGVTVEERNALGVRYRDLTIYGPFVRSLAERNYGYTLTSPHLEESIHLFESILGTMLEIAAFESKIKMLGLEISRVTRTTRVLEERVLPGLRADIRTIIEYIGEREREANFRLRRFKATRGSRSIVPTGRLLSASEPDRPANRGSPNC
ncbi:MAG TPA: V-type ATP synthase subunit D [Bryobacteraceae bacterium]|nr:V-type ATP synthase subunit D [Bryobacteraceae bacterium]